MKLFIVYIVLVAFASAHVSAHVSAKSLKVPTETLFELGTAFLGLIKTKIMVKQVELQNQEVLTPALNDVAREMNEGLDSDIFRFGIDIHKALVHININVGQIAGNTTSLASEIEATADTISKIHLNKKLADYTLKKNRVKQICDQSLTKTKIILTLIDETKAMLGINVSVPLKYLRTSMEATSQAKIEENRAIIRREVEATDHWWIWFFPRVESTAKAIKAQSEDKIQKIQIILDTITKHAEWLEKMCIDIKDELDKSRTEIAKIEGKAKSTNATTATISQLYDIMLFNKTITEDELDDASEVIVDAMVQLKNEVLEIINRRQRRSVPSTPLWFNQKMSTDNGCVYIYNNRTAGCISSSTFSSMKKQYESLSQNISKFENMIARHEHEINTRIKNVKKSMQSVQKSTDITQNDVMDYIMLKISLMRVQRNVDTMMNDVKKIRVLSVTLNVFAEIIFSEANAQKLVKSNVDDDLNREINELLVFNQKEAEKLSENCLRDNTIIQEKLNKIRATPFVFEETESPLLSGNELEKRQETSSSGFLLL